MSAPAYHVSKVYGLLRTDCAQPGYGRAVSAATVIKLAAERHGARLASKQEQPK